jgi:hypothetical protein
VVAAVDGGRTADGRGEEQYHVLEVGDSPESNLDQCGTRLSVGPRLVLDYPLVVGITQCRRHQVGVARDGADLAKGLDRNGAERSGRWVFGVDDVGAPGEGGGGLMVIVHAHQKPHGRVSPSCHRTWGPVGASTWVAEAEACALQSTETWRSTETERWSTETGTRQTFETGTSRRSMDTCS